MSTEIRSGDCNRSAAQSINRLTNGAINQSTNGSINQSTAQGNTRKIDCGTLQFPDAGDTSSRKGDYILAPVAGGPTPQLLPCGNCEEDDGDLEEEVLISVTPENEANIIVLDVDEDDDLDGDLGVISERLKSESITLSGGLTALPPFTLQKIIEDYDDASDREDSPPPLVEPILHGKVMRRLCVTEDGFIRMRNYKISFDVIGSGKLSEVRIALDERDSQQYAIKIFSRTKLQKFNMLLRTSRNPIEEAYREVAILRRLQHPNVIKLIDVIDDPEDENMYLVLELLEHVITEIPALSPVSEAVARFYFRDIVDGVVHLHSCGIVHRDIKPENLLVSKEGIVKIVDFNICVELEKDADGREQPVECWHGTPAFTPPECLQPDQKRAAGRPLDVWSLGVTLFACVTGNLPFRADGLLPDLFESILTDPVSFPPGLVISDDLKDLIGGLLRKDPRERLTMDQVQQHPWFKFCPLTRTRSDAKRSVPDFSKRCFWDVSDYQSDAELERQRQQQYSSGANRTDEQRRLGSAHHPMDEEVEKLVLHGYTVL
ncbi:Calcium/calmodulin-dependent protein kinase kinase 2 [Hypsibius exemplaris]|uniref:Calcium/calmodulin-dependent protein kinase kinase 2 n=1 Tax=Hypsibius exemplaris TaxID=2072580 RepID=A0A1W0WP90_HYPEX|nr:Calcium/calmodulin-dependent protein kinase kinase 2 [Hypsibius exemplaris]